MKVRAPSSHHQFPVTFQRKLQQLPARRVAYYAPMTELFAVVARGWAVV